MAKKQPKLTKEQADTLYYSLELDSLLENEEEVELLEANNPELLDAYKALVAIVESFSE